MAQTALAGSGSSKKGCFVPFFFSIPYYLCNHYSPELCFIIVLNVFIPEIIPMYLQYA
jgi:hypothetical protein